MLYFSVNFVQGQLIDVWLLLHKEPRFRKVLSGLCLLKRKDALFLRFFSGNHKFPL